MIRLLALFLFFPLISASAALPSVSCAERDTVVKNLWNGYKERSVATGITSGGSIIELFQSNLGVTWTLLIVNTDGMACVLSSGDSWIKEGKKLGVPL